MRVTASNPTTKPSNRRWVLWLALLAFALWLTFFGDSAPMSNSQVVGIAARSIDSASTKNTAGAASNSKESTSLEMLQSRDTLYAKSASTRAVNDLFAVGTWSPPAPIKPMAQPLPPLAPTAPAIPFTYLGKKLEADAWEVFISRGEQTYVVREGAVIDNLYRITKIAPPQMSLLYLPLNQTQTLPIGESP